MSNKITVYVPDNSIKKGFLSIFSEIYSEIVSNKWLTYQFIKRDFAAMNKQSLIGILWIFIVPIINVAIFAMLNRSGIFNVGDINVPYPLFALLGMTFWQLFASGVTSGGNSLNASGDMITRINFSKISLVLSGIGRPVISFFIQLAMIVMLFIFYRIAPAKTCLLAPLVLIPLVLLTLGISFIIALLNAIIKDTGNFLALAISLMMYATPVLYAKPMKGLLLEITRYNPMYYLISAGRDLTVKGTITEMNGFIISTIASLVIFAVAIVIFHVTETRVAERI